MGVPLFDCCGESGRVLLRDYLAFECFDEDRALTSDLRARESANPAIKYLLTFLGEVYVVDLPPPALALRLSGRCPECGLTTSVIVIATHLLMTVRQILLIVAETIEGWEIEYNGRLKVEHGRPSAAQVAEWTELLAEFRGDVEPRPGRFLSFDERWSALQPQVAAAFGATAGLAWLWFVAHEAAHAFETTSLSFPHERYHEIKAVIAADVASHVADVEVARRYASELTSDTIAVDILWNGLMPGLAESHPIELARTMAAAEVAGAIALVCETFFRVEEATFLRQSDYGDRMPDHPSGSSRFRTMVSYLSHLSGEADPAAFHYLAASIGKAVWIYQQQEKLHQAARCRNS
jgi:hypothetical protein